jgi:hypothetical protein
MDVENHNIGILVANPVCNHIVENYRVGRLLRLPAQVKIRLRRALEHVPRLHDGHISQHSPYRSEEDVFEYDWCAVPAKPPQRHSDEPEQGREDCGALVDALLEVFVT